MKLPPEHVHGIGLKSATAYGGLGEKLLKQYGWKEGEGLGLQGTGIASAIKVLKKDDTIGVSLFKRHSTQYTAGEQPN